MKNTILNTSIILGLALCGCTDTKHQLKRSTASTSQRAGAYPVTRVSRGAGHIASAHARVDDRGLVVTGFLEQHGPGWVTAAWSHVDVLVSNPSGRIVTGLPTTFSPSQVPTPLRGLRGHSTFVARVSFVPSPGSTIQVVFHQTPLSKCELNEPS